MTATLTDQQRARIVLTARAVERACGWLLVCAGSLAAAVVVVVVVQRARPARDALENTAALVTVYLACAVMLVAGWRIARPGRDPSSVQDARRIVGVALAGVGAIGLIMGPVGWLPATGTSSPWRPR